MIWPVRPSGFLCQTRSRPSFDRRYQEYLANPREGSTWDEVKRRVLGSK